ncbi:MAG: plastocyanin [Pseudomonadota bacterium]
MKKILLVYSLVAACNWASAGNLVVSVIDREGKPVLDAVVVVIPANKSVLPRTPPPAEASINQEKMQFIPAITLVSPGAKIKLANNDPWNHHIRSSPAGAEQFNSTKVGFDLMLEGKPEGKPAKTGEITLDKPGVVTANLLGCYIHGSMRGYIYVSESPWASKTSAEGFTTFENLPDGPAQIKVWQAEQLIDLPLQQTTIGQTMGKNVFQLTVVPRRRR